MKLCDLEGWDDGLSGRRLKTEGMHVYIQLIHMVVQQKHNIVKQLHTS